MDITFIRHTDRFVGDILCAILKLFKIKYNKLDRNKINKILVLKIWGIGSVINCMPAVKALRKEFPNSKMIFLTMQNNKGLYDDNKQLIDEIIYISIKNIFSLMRDTIKTLAYLRKEKIDLFIDLEIISRFTAILSFLSGAKIKIGYKTSGLSRDMLYDIQIEYKSNSHIKNIFYDSVRDVVSKNGDMSLVKPVFTKKDTTSSEEILRQNNLKKKEYIVINVNSSYIVKERAWPLQNFAKLSDHILDNFKIKLIFIGSKPEANGINLCLNMMQHDALNLAGKTNLKQLSYLIGNSKLLITNDSGPLHMGVMMGTPSVSFFGPETPVLYGPMHKKLHHVFYNKIPCSPCISIYNAKQVKCTKNAECMSLIKESEVELVVDRLLLGMGTKHKKR